MSAYIREWLAEFGVILDTLTIRDLEGLIEWAGNIKRRKRRLFVLGVGGSAANASHCVNDLRKLCGIEAYAPTDNVAELTARTNDDGWETIFVEWLKVSQLRKFDGVLVLSVGGGQPTVSACLSRALVYAKRRGALIAGIVGASGGMTAKLAHVCVKVPEVSVDRRTPFVESAQAVIWHLVVNHPSLRLPA